MAHTPFWESTATLCPARLSLLIIRPASSHWMMLGVGQIQQALKWWKVPWVACLSDKVLFLLLFFFFCSLGLFTAHNSSLLSLILHHMGNMVGRLDVLVQMLSVSGYTAENSVVGTFKGYLQVIRQNVAPAALDSCFYNHALITNYLPWVIYWFPPVPASEPQEYLNRLMARGSVQVIIKASTWDHVNDAFQLLQSIQRQWGGELQSARK